MTLLPLSKRIIDPSVSYRCRLISLLWQVVTKSIVFEESQLMEEQVDWFNSIQGIVVMEVHDFIDPSICYR